MPRKTLGPRTSLVRTGRAGIVFVAALLLVSAFSVALQAQVLYGSLTGNVTDPTKALLPGARVEALNVDTGVARQAITNNDGIFLFAELQPGIYKVTISADNFGTKITENVRVAPNSSTRIDAELQLKQQAATVEVTSAAPLLQTDRADVHTDLDAKQIANLPNSSSEGRSFQSLYKIIPGFTPPAETNSQGGNPQRSQTSNVNGGSTQGNVTRIDGATDLYPWLPANVAYVPPADAIETVNIATNSFDAEQGFAGGAAVNVQIKTGTNQFHGSAHEFHTDNALAARNFFNAPTFHKPKNILNQFGGTFGGPIKKNKLFFFGDYEGTRNNLFASQLNLNVPNIAGI